MSIENATFLYVEDDPMSRKVMEMLMSSTMKVKNLTMFEDSRDFLSRLQSLPQVPAVIMLDIHMQPHNGFELLTMIRERAAYHDTKVIALTASVMNQEITRLRESGFDGAIAKPLSIQSFPDLISEVLNGASIWHIE